MSVYTLAEREFNTMAPYGEPMELRPRQKFNFYVQFQTAKLSKDDGDDSQRDTTRSVPYPLAVQIDLPSVQFDTQVVNQYNRKRVIQTGYQYNPINIVFFDTVDNTFQTLYQNYFKYYYKDRINSPSKIKQYDSVTPESGSGSWGGGFGFQPPTYLYQKNFIQEIIISRGWPDELTLENVKKLDPIVLYNPTVNSISHDTLDYGSSDPITWTMNISFEQVHYLANQSDESNNDDQSRSVSSRLNIADALTDITG